MSQLPYTFLKKMIIVAQFRGDTHLNVVQHMSLSSFHRTLCYVYMVRKTYNKAVFDMIMPGYIYYTSKSNFKRF